MTELKSAIFVFGMLLLAVSGCSTINNLKAFTSAYQEPESATTTRLRVVTDQVVRLVPDRSCVAWDAPGAGVVSSRNAGVANSKILNDQRIGMPGGEQVKDASEVYVRSNSPITVVYNGARSMYECAVYAYFVPEANSDYEVSAYLPYASCGIRIAKLVKGVGDGEVVREPVLAHQAKLCD